VIRALFRFVDERTASAPLLRKALRYVFPDHWSFLLGEVALYAFIVLVGTGIYLAFFFDPSTASTHYNGSYVPLQGHEMSQAYRSAVDLSFKVKAGLLLRQTHHWAADVFVAAIVLHMLRIFFTGAFRKPRDLTYFIGLAMLGTALLEGYLGLLAGRRPALGDGARDRLLGADVGAVRGREPGVADLGRALPGSSSFESRMYIAHVFLLPILIGTLLTVHLALVAVRHHTQFRGRRKTEQKVVGIPAFPGQAPRSLGLAFAVAAVLFLLGGLVQINPVWLWGPFHVGDATNGAQPDWYLGWLIGALRLMPSFDVTIGNYTLVPNPFWGGALFPLAVFGLLFAWPWLERRFTGDQAFHNLLDRPRDAPWRTAVGVAFFTWVFVVFLAGASDRVFIFLGISYGAQIWVYRVAFFVLPPLVLVLTHRICLELQGVEKLKRRRREAEAGPA